MPDTIPVPPTAMLALRVVEGDDSPCAELYGSDYDSGVSGLAGRGSLTVPEKVKYAGVEYTITGAGYYAFKTPRLVSVTLPDTVRTISSWAFGGCTDLESVVIPDSVTEIPHYTFVGCTSLRSVDMGNNVTGVDRGAFTNCPSLADVRFSESLVTLSKEAFSGCKALTEVTLPASLETCEEAFVNTNLETVHFAQGTTAVPERAFDAVDTLRTVELPATVASIGSSAFSSTIPWTG